MRVWRTDHNDGTSWRDATGVERMSKPFPGRVSSTQVGSSEGASVGVGNTIMSVGVGVAGMGVGTRVVGTAVVGTRVVGTRVVGA